MSGPDGGLGRAPYGPAGATGGPGYPYPTGGPVGPPGGPAGHAGGPPGHVGGPPGPLGGNYPPGAAGGRSAVDPAKLLGLAVASLGGLNFIWGFLPEITAPRIDENLSVFAVGPGYVPILLLIAGLLALAAFLPGSERSRLAVAAVSVGGAAGAIVSLGMAGPVELLGSGQVNKGLGAILLVIFGIIQAVVAIGGYVIGADFSGRAIGNAAASAVTGPIPVVQPGWYGQSPGGAPAGFRPPVPMPYPDEAVTGPQVVIGTETRARGPVPGPPTPATPAPATPDPSAKPDPSAVTDSGSGPDPDSTPGSGGQAGTSGRDLPAQQDHRHH